MSDHDRINELHAKIGHLLSAINRNGDRFSNIDKDLAMGYVRELYELIVAIKPVMGPAVMDIPVVEVRTPEALPDKPPVILKEVEESITAIVNPAADRKEDVAPENSVETDHGSQKIYVAKQSAKEKPNKKTISELFADDSTSQRDTLNEKYKPKGKEIADRLKHTPIKDLKAYIGLNKRFTFINALFMGKAERYDAVITRVNDAPGYQEALDYIQQQVMTEFNWKEEEPVVADFFTLVMRRFLN